MEVFSSYVIFPWLFSTGNRNAQLQASALRYNWALVRFHPDPGVPAADWPPNQNHSLPYYVFSEHKPARCNACPPGARKTWNIFLTKSIPEVSWESADTVCAYLHYAELEWLPARMDALTPYSTEIKQASQKRFIAFPKAQISLLSFVLNCSSKFVIILP